MIYLDLGSNDGRSIKDFVDGKFTIKPKRGTIIMAFEPIVEFNNKIVAASSDFDLSIMNVAAFDRDGETEFAILGLCKIGSSLMKSRNGYDDAEEKRMVPCIDFSTFVAGLEDDEIVMRMDIEGAEYPVLDKMLKDGTLNKIKYAEIEWHHSKLEDHWNKGHTKFEGELKAAGFNFKTLER